MPVSLTGIWAAVRHQSTDEAMPSRRVSSCQPFMSVADQVKLLTSRGLATDPRTAWVLEREGYYSVINGYKSPFLDEPKTKETNDDRS